MCECANIKRDILIEEKAKTFLPSVISGINDI